MTYYVTLLLTYFFIYALAVVALDLSFGLAGIVNLAFVLFQGVGGYAYALLTLGPPGHGISAGQAYVAGTSIPFPLPFIGALIAGMLVSLPIGAVVLRRLRADYQAVALLAIMLVGYGIIENSQSLVNGDTGLGNIPQPLRATLNLSITGYDWFYVGLAGAVAVLGIVVVRLIYRSPYGRIVAAAREHEGALESLGKSAYSLRLAVFAVSSGLGALSGALLVGYLGSWSPLSWSFLPGVILLAALTVGGIESIRGAIVGTLIVEIVILQGATFLPQFGRPGLVPAISQLIVALLLIGSLWLRPRGMIPEVRPKLRVAWPESIGQMVDGIWNLRPSAAPNATVLAGGTAATDVDANVAVLETSDVGYSFGGVRAVDSVSMAIHSGQITGIIGPNGAGKSTLLNLLSGELRASSGQIRLRGSDITRFSRHRRARLGLQRTFQQSSEFGRLTVVENVLVGARLGRSESLVRALGGRRWWRAAEELAIGRAAPIVQSMGLRERAHQRAMHLSGGERRLVELGRTIIGDCAVLILDEPFAGIHPKLIDRLCRTLESLRAEGVGIAMTLHEPELIARLCDHVYVMAEGRLVAEGGYSEVVERSEVVHAYLGTAR